MEQNATPEYSSQWIRRWIIEHRCIHNKNNCTRTDFYLRYWNKHPEVPWTLIAHFVSRNAGYQMSDLARLDRLLHRNRILAMLATGSPSISSTDNLFAFLETGNFLIFYDVFPQLSMYAWAKHLRNTASRVDSTALFDILKEEEFGVDPFIADEWKQFFLEAERNVWWTNDSNVATYDPVARQTLALVANEQNYIEKRLVNPDPSTLRYFDERQHRTTLKLIRRISGRGFPRLVVVEADPRNATKPGEFLLCRVDDFVDLDGRIDVGRRLYSCIFRSGPARSSLVQSWVRDSHNQVHHGTRMDYDYLCYDIEPPPDKQDGHVYSPPLTAYKSHMPLWPIDPGKDERFSLTHMRPMLLRPWSKKFKQSRLDGWLTVVDESAVDIAVFSPARRPSEILL